MKGEAGHRRGAWLLGLALIGLAVGLVEAHFVAQPGYMDACYTYNTGASLEEGRGLAENYLWNYLDDPSGLPHPAGLYWMPLASFIAAAGMRIAGTGFRAAQFPFLLLLALLPAATAWLGLRLTASPRKALVAGLLAIFSCFYAVYVASTDTFVLYALIGTAFLVVLAQAFEGGGAGALLAVGVLSGLAHLTRADGILFLGVGLFGALVSRPSPADLRRGAGRALLARARRLGLVIAGYLLVAGAWYGRNLAELGRLFPPAGFRTLWLVTYDEFFHYPASDLTPAHWLASGWGPILQARWLALVWNLQTVLFVQGWVALAPLVALGLWRLRKSSLVRVGALYFGLLSVLMTLVYPWSGSRGGLLHSSSALLPLLAVAAAEGLDAALDWAARLRGWDPRRAQILGSTLLVAVAAATTALIFWERVIGPDPRAPAWASQDRAYREAGVLLRGQGSPGPVIAVNNPPCFYYQTHLASIVVPDGDLTTLMQVVDRYGATDVILDANAPAGLRPLYEGKEKSPRLQEIARLEDGSPAGAIVFRVQP